jgi:pyridoxal phosphate enzyme (YggS family)
MSSIPDNLAHIKEVIDAACERAGRDPSEVLLVGASKQVPPDRIREAFSAGLPALGENYVQEALPKIEALGHPIPWHFIGHLQRNKSKVAAQNFDLVQTVDGLSLAQALSRHAEAAAKTLPVLLEVNLAGRPDRPGVSPDSVADLADQIAALPSLRLHGLMGMPPPGPDPESARPYFRTLKRLWDALHNENRLILSMGMTADYPVAIEEGSTLVRIGTGIFGRREHGPQG